MSTPASPAASPCPAPPPCETASASPLPGGGLLYLVSLASGAYCAAHGYLAHDQSVGWGLAWWAFGTFVPGFAPAIAWAKGFGQPVAPKSGS